LTRPRSTSVCEVRRLIKGVGRKSRKAGERVVRHGRSAAERLPHGTTTAQLTRKQAAQYGSNPLAQLSKPLQRTQQLHVNPFEPFDMARRCHDVSTGKQNRRTAFGT